MAHNHYIPTLYCGYGGTDLLYYAFMHVHLHACALICVLCSAPFYFALSFNVLVVIVDVCVPLSKRAQPIVYVLERNI